MALDQWPIFSLLDPAFFQQIRFAAVLGAAGNEALIVTKEDEVYALGSNSYGCLGVGDCNSTLLPRKVLQLCKKGVGDLAYGSGPHIVAVTSDGKLFSWGHNGYGQLGQGLAVTSGQYISSPQKIEGPLEGTAVVKVACGGHHTLALTKGGKVYAWGYNNCGQVGSDSTGNQTTPRQVRGELDDVDCVSVSCTQSSSLALSQKGELFAWGYNGNGQLGIGSYLNKNTPQRVHSPAVVFKQVVCGYAHVLALTDEGEVYAWGSNNFGQLGNGTKTNKLIPSLTGSNWGRIVGVAANHCNYISAAASFSGKVYMWGMCRGQSVLTPLETRFSSLDDVFSSFASPSCSWRTISVTKSENDCGLVKCIAQKFNDSSTSDLTIVVEDRRIHVHKAILRMRCEYFNSMFQQGRWTEAGKDLLEVCNFPYSVYVRFLKFLYTDQVDSENLTLDETISLLDLADSYCETQLKLRCEVLIWQQVSIENVAMLIAMATKYKTENLEEQCYRFALNHMTQVVQSEAFHQIDSSIAKLMIQKVAQMGAFKT